MTRARRFLFCGMLICVLSAGTVGAQATAPAPELRERLTRISADLFSPAPHINDDIRALKEILAGGAGVAEAHLLLGIAYRRLGSADLVSEAIAELRQALALNADLLPARLYLAYIYLDIGRPERAREEMETALERAPDNAQFLALAGEAERQMRNPRRAAELARQALRADESFAEGRYYLGLALFDLGQRAEAIKELEQVVGSGQAVADAYLSLGIAYLEGGRLDDAVKTLVQGTRMDPSRPDLRIQLARAYRLKGQAENAAEQLRLARPAGGAPSAPTEYRQQQLEFDFALEQGLLEGQRGRLAAAIAAFKKALAMDPNHGAANRYLAEIYLRQGAYAAAAQYAARAEKAGAPLTAEERRQIQEGLRRKK